MKKKLLSIITPSYNCKDKIESTILSVLKQDMKYIEYIVVDGNSTDGTIEILDKYKNSLLYSSEPDKGIYDAMNKGIDLAKGEYIFFLGAGDTLRDEILNIVTRELKSKKYDFIYGNVYMNNIKIVYNGKYNIYKIMLSNICHQAIFYKKELFYKLGKYGNEYNVYEDHYFNIKCFNKKNNINKRYLPYIIANYEGQGFSDKNKDVKFRKDLESIIYKNFGIFYLIIFRLRNYLVKLLHKIKLEYFVKSIRSKKLDIEKIKFYRKTFKKYINIKK